MSWAILPTFDYIDWMKIRKTTTVKIPILGNKIPLSYIFSIYGIFMVSVIIQYLIKLVRIFKFGLPDQDRFASKIVKDPNER
jgi:C4-dicarboxylate transporter DctQ subunit|tara:strand:- start:280 stop:525 length:246 start_codon:yes stop_codon:yes gene_type:complete